MPVQSPGSLDALAGPGLPFRGHVRSVADRHTGRERPPTEGVFMGTPAGQPQSPTPPGQDRRPPDTKLEGGVSKVLTALCPQGNRIERRSGLRYPYPYLVQLTPVGADGTPAACGGRGKTPFGARAGVLPPSALAAPADDRPVGDRRSPTGAAHRRDLVPLPQAGMVRKRGAVSSDRSRRAEPSVGRRERLSLRLDSLESSRHHAMLRPTCVNFGISYDG